MKLQRAKTYWRLFWHFRRIHLMKTLEYRSDLLFWSCISIMWTIFNFFLFDVMVNVSGSIGGWNRHELRVLIGIVTMLDALMYTLIYHCMKYYSQMVFSGEFNKVLLTPIDSQFLIMIHHNSFNNIFRFFIGIGAIALGLNSLGLQPNIFQVGLFVVLLGCSFMFLYSLWFMAATLSFYFERLDNINEVFPAVRRAWQVPRTVYTGFTSLLLTVIFPISLISSIPAEILLGRASFAWILYFFGVTVFTFTCSRIFYKLSLKRYSGQAS